MTVVEVCSELYGDVRAVAVFLSQVEAIVEMPYTPPIGTAMTLRIQAIDHGVVGEIVLEGVVEGRMRPGDYGRCRVRIALQRAVPARFDDQASVH